MTLNDIIVSALAQLNRGHDSQTVDIWRDKLIGFVNDAAQDLGKVLGLRRSDALNVVNGEIDVSQLPRSCYRVLSITQNGIQVSFDQGSATGKLKVLADGAVTVEYRYMPRPLSSPTDIPELPEHVHPLIATYVVARERGSQDPTMQRGANVYFEMYQAGKEGLRKHLGEQSAYTFKNRW